MRLRRVYLSRYKNLKKFNIKFDGDDFIEVFVGKNASGKSNFFEALIEIFRHIYEYDSKNGHEVFFDYKITYEIDGEDISIEFNASLGELSVNDKPRKTVGQTALPDNVLIYYAGHNDAVREVLRTYKEKFLSRIKSADISESRKFIGIDSDYKDLLLSLVVMQAEGCTSKQFVLDKLGVQSLGDELKLVLRRPTYAKDSSYDVQSNDAEFRYWKPEGAVKDFLDKLDICLSPATGDLVRTEGYLADSDTYQLYYSLEKIREVFDTSDILSLFRQFDNLKTLQMLESISVNLKLSNGLEANLSDFSDGQFQTIYLFAVSEIFKQANCITLMDEPDSFLHPEWQFECLDQVRQISAQASKTNHVLMSSHSAVTLIQSPQPIIRYFDIKDGFANTYKLPKRLAVHKLSSDVIKYSENEQILSVINTIQIANKPVLFTEGSTDPIILKEAWYKLYEDEMPFIPFYAFSCTYINQLLTDDRIHNEMNGLPVLALFDFDKAYNSWNGLNGAVICDNVKDGLVKKWSGGESYAFMLPIPNNEHISSQVIRCSESNETYGSDSLCEIEHLFYGHEKTEEYFTKKPDRGGELVVFASDNQKTAFSKDVVPSLEAECFEVFRPMFEFIRQLCTT